MNIQKITFKILKDDNKILTENNITELLNKANVSLDFLNQFINEKLYVFKNLEKYLDNNRHLTKTSSTDAYNGHYIKIIKTLTNFDFVEVILYPEIQSK